MAGAEGGLGVLAACRGDHAGAARWLKASLDKRFSAVFAGVYRQAKSQTKSDSNPPPDTPPSPAANTKLIPEPPVFTERGRTLGAKASLGRLRRTANDRIEWLRQKLERLLALIRELDARNAQDPGSAMVFRRVFDKEIFQFGEVMELTLGQRLMALTPTVHATTAVTRKVAEEMFDRVVVADAKAAPLRKK